jgi:GNAT superfamily N-acetyltransferase
MSGALAITEARTEADMRDVRKLCNGFLNWLRERYSNELWLIDRYYAPAQWQAVLDSLPTVHAPPEGEIILARLNGAPAGCVMLRRLEGDICEMKRLFVAPHVRGHQVGRKLCERLMEVAAERGYSIMRLDTGVHHHEAIPLYRSLGFRMRDAYYDCPPDVAPLLHFMEGDLRA